MKDVLPFSHSEDYKHRRHWEADEIEVIATGAGGEQNLGSSPTLQDRYIRIKEVTIRNSATSDSVVTLLSLENAVYVIKISIDIPSGTTREWESEQGRRFDYGQQPVIRADCVTGGTIFVTGSGIIASMTEV